MSKTRFFSHCIRGRFIQAPALLAVSLAFAMPPANAAQLLIDADTFLKSSTAQASTLPAASKCAFTRGQSFEITSLVDGGSDHHKVTLQRALPGCALTVGYVYKPHSSTEANVLSVRVATLFKLSTADSSTLPASSKCDIPAGVYASSAAISTSTGHFKATLKTALPGCGFTTGYVFDDFAASGIVQVSTSADTWFKKTTADAATLPAADKCLVAKGNYTLTQKASITGTHYAMTFVAAPVGCGFTTGYMSHELTYLSGPAFNPASYTKPLASGIAGGGGQAWCVCRDVGTSPHVGQDWNASGAENSVAIANGSIVEKTFSSTCGHAVKLRDSGGADWIYRHLNSNSLAVGQNVTKGQFLGAHSAYPTSSCGTGPHLHIERRSAGAFGDSARFKSCEAGPEACNFNPNSPFETTATMKAPVEDMTVTGEMTGNSAADSACRVEPARFGRVEAAQLARWPVTAASRGLMLAGEVVARDGARVVGIAASAGANGDNVCAGDAGCLTSWSLVVETAGGDWVRVFHDGALRDRPAAVLADEGHCLPADATGRALLLVTDAAGQRYRKAFSLK
ncbi:MAG: M23 family metallopeptidase [Betaproteobacteria bacterium]|nr:M23 family metallopeptidase [Betaproteobacteria bacterium]